MLNYIIRRLILLPITLFCIILVNFVIVNLAPGEPVTITQISQQGNATRSADRSVAFGSDLRYLQFREYYGLTLPILFNPWPYITYNEMLNNLWRVTYRKQSPASAAAMSFQDYDDLRIRFGDQARFVMPLLLKAILDPSLSKKEQEMAILFFSRGGTRLPYVGPDLTHEQMQYNRKVSKDTSLLEGLIIKPEDTTKEMENKIETLKKWYEANKAFYDFEPTKSQKIWMFFFDTRFCKYMGRVLRLDFGTLRNDTNKTVIREVTKRFKYSLTLSITPMLITFVLCQIFAFIMALNQRRWPDYSLNVCFLILYAIPIFVVGPFLIEEVAMKYDFPFTDIPIPYSGFRSADPIYDRQTSLQRLFDVIRHIVLPVTAIMYGSLAAQARLSRTAVLEVLRQDYVRTAWAKGVPRLSILSKHVGRNAAITVVTSIAGSLGIVLGGSLIIETLFEINGFGKFFYDAIVNRDYNVIMFSALAGSFLALLGYLAADIAYTVLDPRVTLE